MPFHDIHPSHDGASQEYRPDESLTIAYEPGVRSAELDGAEVQARSADEAAQEPELRVAAGELAGRTALRESVRNDQEAPNSAATDPEDPLTPGSPDQDDSATDAVASESDVVDEEHKEGTSGPDATSGGDSSSPPGGDYGGKDGSDSSGNGEDDGADRPEDDDLPRLSESARAKLEFAGENPPVSYADRQGKLTGVTFPPMPDGTILGGIDLDTTSDDMVELANIGEPTVRIDNMNLDTEVRGFGLGTQMVQALANECRLQGVASIDGHFISPAAIGTMVNAFGEENIQFYDDLTTPIPLTLDQAYETVSDEWRAELIEIKKIKGPSVDPDDVTPGVYIRGRL